MARIHRHLIILTPIFLLLTHYLAVFPHEYAHSFMAWLLGYKSNPLALNYGGTSWTNLLFLMHIDQNVDYQPIFLSGKSFEVSLITLAGPGIANGLLFVLSFFMLRKNNIQQQPYLFYFLFLFNLMNLGNFYCYVPIRTFTSHGDVADFVAGLRLSSWWIYAIGGYLVAFLIWQFFTHTLAIAYSKLQLTTVALKASLMVLCVGVLFGFYGLPGFFDYGEVSYFLSATSFLMIPGIIIILWPAQDNVTIKTKEKNW